LLTTRRASGWAFCLCVIVPLLAPPSLASAQAPRPNPDQPLVSASLVVTWNNALLEAIRRTNFRPMWSARALAVVHTAMFDAWAAYHPTAIGVQWATDFRRPVGERSSEFKDVAVSFAAYRALVDLFPTQQATLFDPLMLELGLDPQDQSRDPSTPTGIGNATADAVVTFRRHDGANQLGDMNGGAPYSDYTGYAPVNTPELLSDPNRWQPLRGADGVAQAFLAPHWGRITPFALSSPDQFQPPQPPQFPEREYYREVEAIRLMSARLTDRDKVIVEYWADGPNTVTPPGHWSLLAQFVSQRDSHTTDEDVVMFFALGNALLDASISVWDCKVVYDYIRPISAVRFLYAGQMIEAWAGPFQGTQLIRGEDFRSYIATPPFAEYTSGHSAFSAASAAILRAFTGDPHFGASVVFAPGSSTIEPGAVPASSVTLAWGTFEEAADEAGLSRRLGGIHFRNGDLQSREMGKRIGQHVWAKVLGYLAGRTTEDAR
jgi:hypothetical protein